MILIKKFYHGRQDIRKNPSKINRTAEEGFLNIIGIDRSPSANIVDMGKIVKIIIKNISKSFFLLYLIAVKQRKSINMTLQSSIKSLANIIAKEKVIIV